MTFGAHVLALATLAVLAVAGGAGAETAASPAPAAAFTPAIDVWYGLHQHFGRPGSPQKWVNILGTVSDPDGVASLSYVLNDGAPSPLSLGPDQRRLLGPGDFNVEIDRSVLKKGLNTVAIAATDAGGNRVDRVVAVEYADDIWPLPYEVHWREVEDVQSAVQVVEGRWTWDDRGIRTTRMGYDRVLAFGDTTWTDYEITVPITVHAIDPSAFQSTISVSPGFGVNLHWLGHTTYPVRCSQPHCGWEPTGGSSWYDFQYNQVRLFAEPPPGHAETNAIRVEPGHTYWFRTRVETTPAGNLYRLKVWEDGSHEPPSWTLERLTTEANLAMGGALLVAHHVDATFGDLTVTRPGNRSAASALTQPLGAAIRRLRGLLR